LRIFHTQLGNGRAGPAGVGRWAFGVGSLSTPGRCGPMGFRGRWSEYSRPVWADGLSG
jgi:hypothetical protein